MYNLLVNRQSLVCALGMSISMKVLWVLTGRRFKEAVVPRSEDKVLKLKWKIYSFNLDPGNIFIFYFVVWEGGRGVAGVGVGVGSWFMTVIGGVLLFSVFLTFLVIRWILVFRCRYWEFLSSSQRLETSFEH